MPSTQETAESHRHHATAAHRILAAGRSLVSRGGAAEISMGDVAREAGVSKALVHYHFRDKRSLLRELVEDTGRRIASRASIDTTVGKAHVLDAFWSWLGEELRAGDLRVLIALGECDDDIVRAAVRRVGNERRRTAIQHTTRIFAELGLRPRIDEALVAETLLSFVDGLVMRSALEPHRDPRPAFDVLWLAMLSLAD